MEGGGREEGEQRLQRRRLYAPSELSSSKACARENRERNRKASKHTYYLPHHTSPMKCLPPRVVSVVQKDRCLSSKERQPKPPRSPCVHPPPTPTPTPPATPTPPEAQREAACLISREEIADPLHTAKDAPGVGVGCGAWGRTGLPPNSELAQRVRSGRPRAAAVFSPCFAPLSRRGSC